MKLKLSLTRPNGAARDVVVTADAIATVGDVATTLLERDPERFGAAVPAQTVSLSVRYPGETSVTALPADTPVSEANIASGVDISVVEASRGGAASGPVLAILRVLEGPDAGAEFPLRAGRSIIGRDASADIVLNDVLVSKRHARVEVTRTIDLVDLNSANGIVVEGSELARVSLAPGQTVLLGNSLLRADSIEADATAPAATRSGPIAFNRSPRVESRYPGEEYEGPDIPKEQEPLPFPWIALAAPAVMGIAFIFLPGVSAFRFLFIALAPIIMIGTFLGQVALRRRRHRIAVERFESQLKYLGETLTSEAFVEREVRLQEAPSTAEVLADATRFGPLLWTRRPEHWSFLNLRLGLGAAPTRNSVTGLNSRSGIAEFTERFEALVESHRLLPGVPFVDSLKDAGALGVAGSPTVAAEATHGLLVQLAGLYSPAEMAFAGVVSPAWSPQFQWLKWLPHTASAFTPLKTVQLADTRVGGNAVLAALEELIVERTGRMSGRLEQDHGPILDDDSVMSRGSTVGEKSAEATDEQRPGIPCIVLLISDDAPVDRARLVAVIERAAQAGIFPIWISDTVAQLPAACRTFLDVDTDTAPVPGTDGLDAVNGTVGYVRLGQRYPLTVTRVKAANALSFARGLAGVSDSGASVADESDMPRSVSLANLLGTGMLDASDAVVDRWRENDSLHDRTPGAPHRKRRSGKLRAIVGQSNLDAMSLDLRVQGPHALVGGTTGSGKSEFLQAWVLAMAAEYSPDRVSFLFIDYKGGSAFADCVELPHTVGLVTDLSPHLVRRALTSLRAELHFREHLFNRKKVKDLIELEKRGDPECPPALVLVIDEFAALVSEVPEFVDGVVDIAQRGRSLGIHLIMATQRPAGVIRDNLRANTNLRIALRMADAHDSVDVVGSPIAATFDPTIPGRGVVKSGPGHLTSFQSGYAGGFTREVEEKPEIEVASLAFGYEESWDDPNPPVEDEQAESGPNDTARLVATMISAAAAAQVWPPRKPWLDELAPTYDLALLRQRSDDELVLGVTDDPTSQQQYPVYFRPDIDGNLAIYGAGGSGKSVALRTLAIAAAITPRGGPVQVYGLDFSAGGLRLLETLPHVGSIVAGDDGERILRLILMLRSTIEERVTRYASVRAGTITEYRGLANKPQEPRILLLVDGMATFRQEYEFTGAGNIFTMFQQILSDGRQVGVHVVISADRPASVSPTISASIQRRIALRLAEDNDYILLDNAADVLGATSPPGRALVDQRETQLAVFGGTSNIAGQANAIDKLAATLRANGVQQAPAIRRLPVNITLDELGELGGVGRAIADQAVIGMADDTLAPVAIVPEGAFIVAGPPSSGRSTALLSIAQATMAAVPGMKMYYFGNTKSPLRTAPYWVTTAAGPDDAAALAKELLEQVSVPVTPEHRIGIVIEAISDFLTTPADAPLLALIKAAKRNDHFVLAEAETSALMPSWPLLMEMKSARRGFGLQPDPQEGDVLFRTSYPRAKRSEFPPGRGYLVQGGKARKVQLGLPG